jgi:hypothetical protein
MEDLKRGQEVICQFYLGEIVFQISIKKMPKKPQIYRL